MSRLRVVRCRVEEDEGGERTTEVARYDLPPVDSLGVAASPPRSRRGGDAPGGAGDAAAGDGGAVGGDRRGGGGGPLPSFPPLRPGSGTDALT